MLPVRRQASPASCRRLARPRMSVAPVLVGESCGVAKSVYVPSSPDDNSGLHALTVEIADQCVDQVGGTEVG